MIKKILLPVVLTLSLLVNPAYTKDNINPTTKQLQALKLLNTPVIAAGWIPKDFKLNKVRVELVAQENPAGISNYQLVYEGDYGKSFSIEVQSGGIGDVLEEPDLKVKTMFGQVDVYTHKNKCVSTGWINYKNKGYMFWGCNADSFIRGFDATPISTSDAIKVIQNLKVLK